MSMLNKTILSYLKLHLFVLAIYLFAGCTNQILIRDANLNGLTDKRANDNIKYSFYSNQNIKNELSYNWDASTYGSLSNTTFTTFDKYLIATDLGGRVTCFNIENGKKIGDLKYKGEISHKAIVDKFKIFFIVNNYNEISSTLVVYDYKTGKEVITTELFDNFSTEILFVNDYIYAVSDLGVVYKFNKNAWILWEKEFDVEVSSNPTTDGKNLFFASSDGNIFSIDLKDGKLNYKKNISSGFQSGISISSNNLYIGDNDGTMFSIDKNNGSIQWSFESNTKIVHSPALDGNSIFFGNLDGDIFSLNKFSSKLNWISNSKGLVNTAPLVLNNCIIQPNLNKHVDVLNKETGELIQNIKFDGRCRTTPIFYKGDIFLGVDKGEVFSYKLN